MHKWYNLIMHGDVQLTLDISFFYTNNTSIIISISRFWFSTSVLLFLNLFFHTAAQNKEKQTHNPDSIKMLYIEQLALKNPMLRQFQMTSELIPHRNINSKLYGNDFIKGDALIYRNNILFKMPIIDWKKVL